MKKGVRKDFLRKQLCVQEQMQISRLSSWAEEKAELKNGHCRSDATRLNGEAN